MRRAAFDKRITDRISAAATCGATQAGAKATAAQLDAAAAACAQISGPGLAADIDLILGAIADLNSGGVLAIKDDVKRQAIADLLLTVQSLVRQIYNSLESQGVVKPKPSARIVGPIYVAVSFSEVLA